MDTPPQKQIETVGHAPGETGRYSFGPVPSRRLGRSLGVNNIPAKVCTYSCVYCQVGKTTRMQHQRAAFYKPKTVFSDVKNRWLAAKAAGESVDYLAVVPDGEPTLDLYLHDLLVLLKGLGVPVAVITNGSLLWQPEVRRALVSADWVSIKVDAAQDTIWRKMNRPDTQLRLPRLLEGMAAFADEFSGTLVTETMLVKGCNDTVDAMEAVADVLHRLRPRTAYISVPMRPPARSWANAPSRPFLEYTRALFSRNVNRVACLFNDEGDDFTSTDEASADLLNILSVHPMRSEAVQTFLLRAGASAHVLDTLLEKQLINEVRHGGNIYFIKTHGAKSTRKERAPSAGNAQRYAAHCQSEFWQSVFRRETDYLAEKLTGCRDVLSVGCGPAFLEKNLSKRGFHVVGVDCDQNMLRSASDGMELVAAKAEALPFPAASFDAVVFVASLEFMEDYLGAIDKATELLRSQGQLVILFLNFHSAYYQKKLQSPNSYVRHIAHKDLQPLKTAIAAIYDVETAYILGEKDGDLFESREPDECLLLCIHGTRKQEL